MGMKVFKLKLVVFLPLMIILGACDFMVPAQPTPLPQPTKTHTPIPSSTATDIPPTETPLPSPTLPSDIWLDTNSYELTVEHPADTEQREWATSNGIILPADGLVGGFVFTAEEINGVWAPAINKDVQGGNSITKNSSTRENPLGEYCVSDYFSKYTPISVCQILAPQATQIDWITPYFAGPKSEVGVAFSVGGCDPKGCTAFLRITNIRLIYYSLPE
jgi:hypothetical protein